MGKKQVIQAKNRVNKKTIKSNLNFVSKKKLRTDDTSTGNWMRYNDY